MTKPKINPHCILNEFLRVCQEASHNKIVIGYNKITKSNDFRHLCENMYSKEVFFRVLWKLLLQSCFYVEKKRHQKIRVEIQQKNLIWIRGVFSWANGNPLIYVKSLSFNHASPCFRITFFLVLLFAFI